MSLAELKKVLNYDQQNILVCDVVQDFDAYTTIRTPSGDNVRASKAAGSTLAIGDQVEVRTDKRVYTIIGPSQYADYSAERSYTI